MLNGLLLCAHVVVGYRGLHGLVAAIRGHGGAEDDPHFRLLRGAHCAGLGEGRSVRAANLEPKGKPRGCRGLHVDCSASRSASKRFSPPWTSNIGSGLPFSLGCLFV